MLHIAHLIERRFGTQRGPRAVARLLLASLLVLALGAGLLLSGVARAQDVDATAVATRVLDHLDAGEYEQVETMFTAQMAEAVPADKLKAVWESLPAQVGEMQGRGEVEAMVMGEVTMVRIPLHYAKAQLQARVAVDAEGRVASLLIQPMQADAMSAPAEAPAADAPYTEREASVGEGERALPGTLTLPKKDGHAGDGPFAAVVLVHGSGPHDRDETIGPNKPFLDIARGLAAQGIAVLRYEKRTKARPQDFASGMFGIDDETTHDAVLAVDALRKAEGIDPARVFVLGHSQGAMMAPRIGAMSGHVAGLVLLAAPARSVLDIVVEQTRRFAVLDDGVTSDAERAAIAQTVEQVRSTRDAATDAATPTLVGQPAGYWRSVDAVLPVDEARAVGLPMLVLQGARDIQVVDADWQAWKAAFDRDPKVVFKLYETLNHLGIAGEGPGNLVEYQQPGHVDAQLIHDVADWIKAH